MSLNYNATHATAYPGSDAPCAHSVARVKIMLAENLQIRKDIHIGCWNFRTLLDTGTQRLTVLNLQNYNVDIACLSEIRIPNTGRKTWTGYMLLYALK